MSERLTGDIDGRDAAARVPGPAWWLGHAGLIPFVAGALLLTAVAFNFANPASAGHVALALVVYGAVILSFLGGVRWGTAMARQETAAMPYALSVVPSLLGWGAALLAPPLALVVLATGVFVQGLIDVGDVHAGRLPAWYAVLRRRLSIVVTAALLVAAASLQLAAAPG